MTSAPPALTLLASAPEVTMPGKDPARGGVRDFVRAFGAADSAELRALREEVRGNTPPVSPAPTPDKPAPDMWSAIFGRWVTCFVVTFRLYVGVVSKLHQCIEFAYREFVGYYL